MSVTLYPHDFAIVRTPTGWAAAPDAAAHPLLLDGISAGFFPWPRRVRNAWFTHGTGSILVDPVVVAGAGEIPPVVRFCIGGEIGALLIGEFLCEQPA